MPARFFCKTGAFAGSSFEIGEEATIGRRTEEAITIASDVVSGQHARIFRDGDYYLLEDLGSSNGTRLDGVEVTAPVRLNDLHVVTFADQIDFIYQEMPASWTPPKREASTAGDRTAFADAFEPVAMPQAGSEAPAPEAEPPDIERTHFGAAFTPMPDLSAAPPGPPTPPASDPAETPTVDPAVDIERTHFGAAFTPMPDLASTDTPTDAGAETEPPPADSVPDDATILAPAPMPADPAVPEDATVLRPAYDPTVAPPFVLDVQRVGAEMERFTLSEGEHTVGRARECEITLDDQSVSRRHAVLIVRDGAVTVRDLGSKNRTQLDGEEIAGETAVPPGAVLRFGLQIEAVVARS